jgi:choline dehydrogenase-like flavoprotein
MDSTRTVDYLLIGTGPAAVAAAMALRRAGASFAMVDVGFDLDPERESLVEKLARKEPAAWSAKDREFLFPPPKTSTKGVEKRFSFGSDFPYRVSEALEIAAENCIVDVSHGFGGFGNVWGAAILPYTDNDLIGWPFPAGDLAPSYRNVLQYLRASSVADDLEKFFPRFHDDGGGLHLSRQIQGLARAIDRRKAALQKNGIWAGRSRVAVDSSGGPSTCRYCGYCLDGCAYGSIFNPRLLCKQLEREGVVIHRGFYALEFREHPDGVETVLLEVKSGRPLVMRSRQLLLGMGTINSTRIVARSLGLVRKPIKIMDSQYFFFPLLSYRKTTEIPTFTLAELFLEVLNPRVSSFYTHFQVYGLNAIFRQTIRGLFPAFLRWQMLLDQLEKRFILFQGFLHSEDSGSLELTLESTAETKDRITLRGIENPRSTGVARSAQRLIRNQLLGYGLIPPFYLKMVPLGRSFHLGGSFPMGGQDPVYRSDRQGRPANLRRVRMVDASTFPSIPATTITFSIMANSDRIVREASELSERIKGVDSPHS